MNSELLEKVKQMRAEKRGKDTDRINSDCLLGQHLY